MVQHSPGIGLGSQTYYPKRGAYGCLPVPQGVATQQRGDWGLVDIRIFFLF